MKSGDVAVADSFLGTRNGHLHCRLRSFGQNADVSYEVECGTGRISLPVSDAFEAILSFDISESMVRLAQEKRDRGAHARNVHYFIGDAENIPVKDVSTMWQSSRVFFATWRIRRFDR